MSHGRLLRSAANVHPIAPAMPNHCIFLIEFQADLYRWISLSDELVIAGYNSLPNVPDHLLPLAFGAEGAQAASVTKVPKAWELGGSAR